MGHQGGSFGKHPPFDFGLGHNLTVNEFKPHIRRWADSTEPAWDSLSPFLSAPPLLLLSLSLKINKLKKQGSGTQFVQLPAATPDSREAL